MKNAAPKLLTVIVRPLLVSAILATDRAGLPVILIDSEQRVKERSIALWHEVVHLILSASDEPEHDEAEIEMLARRLYAAWPGALRRIRRKRCPG